MELSFRSVQEIQNAFAFVNKRLNRVISGDIPINSSSVSLNHIHSRVWLFEYKYFHFQ